MQKGNRKKGRKDKTLIAVTVICVVVVIGIILAVVLPEPIIASVCLNNTKNFISGSDTVSVVINAPLESGAEIFSNAQATLEGEEAIKMAEDINDVLKNAKYSSTKSAQYGVWKTKITVYNSNDECKLYIDEDGIYILNEGRLITYKIKKAGASEFDKLYLNISNEITSE